MRNCHQRSWLPKSKAVEKHTCTLVRLALALILGICGFHHDTVAATQVGMDNAIDDGAGISVECTLPMSEIPSSGYWPVRMRISNTTSEAHTWELKFVAGGAGPTGQHGMSYSTTLSAGAREVREWDILVPRPALDTRNRAYGMIRGRINGYGVKGSGDFYIPTHYSGGWQSTAFVMMSNSLASSAWSKIDAEVKTVSTTTTATNLAHITSLRFGSGSRGGSRYGSRDLNGAQITLKEMPADWRAFAGASGLWLSRVDWENLSSNHRRAIRQWIAAGGHLFVASTEDKIASLPLLPADLEVGKQRPLGMGWIKAVKLVGGELPPAETAQEILTLDTAPVPAWQEEYRERWALPYFVGWPKLNVPVLIGFVALFAIVIGPINLRWFAPPKRRSRLFFTIPVLSVAASVVLFAAIGISDGFGAFGGRNALLYMPAAENEVTLLQEQVVRSRLLFGRAFKLPETVQISFAPQEKESDKGLSFARDGDMVSGDWFRSRSVQTHILRTHVPSRAEVILQSGGTAGAPPVLLSSAATVLSDVHYIDAAGGYWRAERLDTGRPAKLESSTRDAFDDWLRRVAKELSPNFEATMREAAHRSGHFYAVTDTMPDILVETLPSVKWQKQTVVCFGTCTGAESK